MLQALNYPTQLPSRAKCPSTWTQMLLHWLLWSSLSSLCLLHSFKWRSNMLQRHTIIDDARHEQWEDGRSTPSVFLFRVRFGLRLCLLYHT